MKILLTIEVEWTSMGQQFFIEVTDSIEGGYSERTRVYSLEQAFGKGKEELGNILTFINKVTEQKLKPMES